MTLRRWNVSIADKQPYYGHAIYIRVVYTCPGCQKDTAFRTSGEVFNYYLQTQQLLRYAQREVAARHACAHCKTTWSLSHDELAVIQEGLDERVTPVWIARARRRLWKKQEPTDATAPKRHLRVAS